ncbi:MAG: hypothetical protein PHO86_03370 [Bacilli bacterium]|nr:hypothetical protein [Bacilli bacterium]
MKKLKSLFLKIKSKLTIKTYQKPLYTTILTLLVINLIVLIVSAIVANAIDDNPGLFDNFIEAFAFGSLKWMLTPTSIISVIDSGNISLVILCALVIAIEMILFSGAIIATLTTALRAYIDKKSHAKGKINMSNHFVILNWNSKGPDVVFNLMTKKYQGTVLVLSDKNKDYVSEEINSLLSIAKIDNEKFKINLIVKEGNPLLHGNLSDISIEKASNIIIMSREDMEVGDDINISNSDLYSLKLVLALGNFDISHDCNIVVEVEDDTTSSKIESMSYTVDTLKNKTVIPISSKRKLGQIIGQAVINPALAQIYYDFFSFEGYEFYSYKNISVENYLASYDNGIPIINLGNLFVLTEDEKTLVSKRETKYTTARELKTVEKIFEEKYTVFVIGNNSKSKYVLENLSLYEKNNSNVFSLRTFSKNDISKLIGEIKRTPGKKKVLVLSDDAVSGDSYDANVFVTLIDLQATFPKRENMSFVTELLDSRNLNSVKDFDIENAIISNKMMSLLLTQLALNANSLKFFEGLLTVDTAEGGDVFDIDVDLIEHLLSLEQDLTFSTKAELINSFYKSFNKKLMLIGLIRDDKIEYLCSNLDEQKKITLEKGDSLIYIKY